ncbi:hypothetical protein, partial [Novosphingobium album (ex Liu et al. 2023)]
TTDPTGHHSRRSTGHRSCRRAQESARAMSGGEKVSIASDPRTIWGLEEHERPAAVIALLQNCAREFTDAVRRDDAGDAQDMVIHALASVAGLFPDPNDNVHKMLQSLIGVFHAAKWGGHKHLLLRATRPIIGTKKGYGHVVLGGFAISAVKILTEVGSMSGREARKVIAEILADAGCSLKTADHGEAKPITGTAIRNWIEMPESFPAQNEIAADMADIHAANLRQRGAVTKDQALEYFRFHAREMVELSRTL